MLKKMIFKVFGSSSDPVENHGVQLAELAGQIMTEPRIIAVIHNADRSSAHFTLPKRNLSTLIRPSGDNSLFHRPHRLPEPFTIAIGSGRVATAT